MDPREKQDGATKEAGLVGAMIDVPIDLDDPTRIVKIGACLGMDNIWNLIKLLRTNSDIFTWSHANMYGISPEIVIHVLNINPKFVPVRQKRRSLGPERSIALKEECDKLLANGFIRESFYLKWISNPVLVKKPNWKWTSCINFPNFNDACPKDCFPLPRIDQLVDATAGHELLSFMDTYSGHNQIAMHVPDQESTSFITKLGLYCYRVMSFQLKNAGATYQHLVNRMFAEQVGKTVEVYVDNMLCKLKKASDHVLDFREMFCVL